MILEAARHAPSGANSQPWHYIVVTDPAVKRESGCGRCSASPTSSRSST
ncbi:MAG: nitroreductase family protein [Candidatus Rokuibacteriota bacterium]